MKRIFTQISLVVILLSSCSPTKEPRSTALTINICSDPQSLDPRMARDLNAVTLVHMLFEGLMRISKTGEAEFALAHSVDISEDSTRFVFHLRESLWSNTDPVTSYDFANSWRSSLSPQFGTDLAYQLYPIKGAQQAKKGEIGTDAVGIYTPDPQTLVVELETATPYFLELLTLPIFFPVHSSALTNPHWFLKKETHIANGPFCLDAWTHSDQISVVKNSNYWEAEQVALPRIDMVMLTADTELRLFEEKGLHWAGSPLSTLPIDTVQAFKNSGALHVSPLSGTYFLRVNTEISSENPLSHPEFRRGLAMAIDRNEIAEHILQGGQKPALELVPPEMGLAPSPLQEGNVEEARSLCNRVLSQRAFNSPIILSYSSATDRNATIAQAIQKQWEDHLGLQVVLEGIEPKVYYQRISQKKFQLAAGSWIADFNDPINFLETFKYKHGSTNNTGWEDPKYVDLLNRSALCKESNERKGLLSEAEAILLEQMPIIPIFHFALNYLQKDEIKDVVISPLGQVDFRWAHFESSEPRVIQ